MSTSEAKTSIVIRDITELSEMRKVEELQRQVWRIDDLEIFPTLALIPLRELGAVLIGAFDGEQLVGFVFGFPGFEPGERESAAGKHLILHSDMLAVMPEYRAHGLGYKLKLAQRDRALAAGIDTVTWTYDPLQSLNAHLNITRLGVISRSYRVNYYGETTSFLHDTGTDRLWVNWSLNSDRVCRRIEIGQPSPPEDLNKLPALVRVGERQEPLSLESDPRSDALVIEIPANINTLRAGDRVSAGRWRQATRKAFAGAMDAGFVVVEFYRLTRNGQALGAYLLRR